MSTPFYDLASLVLVPSGYKAQKVYAQKPLTTDGQLTFSRASTATRVNSAGLIETVSSNVPRLDYLGSTCPKLQLEPQRTNVVLHSSKFDDPLWAKVNCTATANFAVSPDGTTNAEKIDFNASLDSSLYQALSGSSAAYSISVFAKYVSGGKYLYIFSPTNSESAKVWFDIEAGTVANQVSGFTGKIENYGNGWFRCTLTNTSNKSLDYMQFGISSTSTARTLSAASVTYLYGAQVEAGAYATSLIPTTSAAVTRLADNAVKTSISSLTSASEYTIYWEGTHIPTSQYNSFATFYNNANANYSARFYRNNTDNEIRAAFFNPDTLLSLDLGSGVTTQTVKCAVRVKAGSYALYVNGVLVNSSTSALAPASNLDAVNLQYYDSSQSFDQKTGQMLFFKTGLTNAQLAELTAL